MAKTANSTTIPEINRRNVVMASAALMLAGGTAAAAPTDGDEALFAAIEAWQGGRAALAELDAESDATEGELTACKAAFPTELLEPLELPGGPRRPWPDPWGGHPARDLVVGSGGDPGSPTGARWMDRG